MTLSPRPYQAEQARIIRAQIRIIQSKIATAEGDRARAQARIDKLSRTLAQEREALQALTGEDR